MTHEQTQLRELLARALARRLEARNVSPDILPDGLDWASCLSYIEDELRDAVQPREIMTRAREIMLEREDSLPEAVVTLGDWARRHGIPTRKALSWVERGYLDAYQSGDIWLISSGTPVPVVPRGIAARRAKLSAQ
ncbi:hypothetical protein ACFSR9_05885 [Deinococcus taklimakanensis]|uniref:DNA-binding protein n=1 Tax=Deinococcus taklimakanensis TaxID=536443 RepID=A0ABW5P295_9DEIO